MSTRTKPSSTAKTAAAGQIEWQGEKLFVAFPCYKTTNPLTAMCLMALALDLGADSVAPDCVFGDAMIYHSRNELARRFLASRCEWSFWLDDDIVIPIGRPNFFIEKCRLPAHYSRDLASVHTVRRLISHNLPFVCGMYLARNNTGRIVASSEVSGDGVFQPITQSSVNAGRVIPVNWAGSGCWLVHRSVFESIMRAMPDLAPAREGGAWNLFKPLSDGRGEDQAFCDRARQVDVQPHLDLGVQCMHVGYKAYGWGA